MPLRDTPPIRVTVQLSNNRIRQARERLGLTMRSIAEQIGLKGPTLIYPIIRNPFIRGEWNPRALMIANLLGESAEDLWSEDWLRVQKTRTTRDLWLKDVIQLEAPSQMERLAETVDSIEQEFENVEEVRKWWEELPEDRLKHILYLRFFESKTLGQIAEEYKLSPERIRSLEGQGLKKLRKIATTQRRREGVD